MARSFNGTTDLIACGTNPPNNFFGGSVTVAAWANSTSGAFCGFTNGADFIQMDISAATGHFIPFFSNGGAGNHIDSGVDVSVGWHHLALVAVASSGVTIYVDGAAHGTSSNHAIANTNSSWQIGSDGAGDFANGKVADVAIWTTNLTSSQMLSLAAGVRPIYVSSANLAGWWPVDGYASPEPDLSSNANNGTLTGTTGGIVGPVQLWRIAAG